MEQGGVRIAELVATLSYAADLGLGQPMAHCLRQTVIALRLGDLVGISDDDREATYYLGLLMNSYCHADAAEQAMWFGDDISMKGDFYEMLSLNPAQAGAALIRNAAAHGSAAERVRRVAALPTRLNAAVQFFSTHSTLGSQFAARVGLPPAVASAISHAYEQWDGRGVPRQLSGEEISLPARLVQMASPFEVLSRRHGALAAAGFVGRQAGKMFDPGLAALLAQHAEELVADVDADASWDAVLQVAPVTGALLSGPDLDVVLEAMADLVDLKSPYFAGHSRGVANLAAEAARVAGMPESEQATVRRAGLLHDLGRLGVSNAIWDKAGPLTDTERDKAHLHPWLTAKMLSRLTGLGPAREIAARHHERLDGSGYPRGLNAASLMPLDRLLAAADVYHAMTEPRPHRDALTPEAASAELAREVRAGRLDGDAVSAVLQAAGHRAPVRREGPAGLTVREVEVLAELARGLASKEIARRLGITPKTAANHVEHIYTKLGVGSRAAATLWATQHGLVGAYEVG
jgi:HD-GYP domain-containing protein (c-di-GMP phosphodiesterase class II)